MIRTILAVIAGFAAWSAAWLIAGATSAALAPGAYNEDGTINSAAVLLDGWPVPESAGGSRWNTPGSC